MTENTAAGIDELLAHVQNKAQELDPGGPAGRALWCVDALCAVVALMQARIDDLEQRLDDTHDLVGPSIERAISDHVRQEWHR